MKKPEQISEHFNNLPLRYKAFFEGLLQDGIDLSWTLRYINLLQTPDLLQKTIPALVTSLQQFEVVPEKATHSEVRAGREILSKFFTLKQPILREYNIIPLVYGSLLYDDPHHLDYDVVLFGQQYEPKIQKLAAIYWPDEINEIGSNNREVQITYTTLQQIEAYVKLFSNDAYERKINNMAFDIQCLMADVSIVFSGSPLVTSDASLLPALRERCTKFMLQEPLIPAVAAYELQEALRVRHERRELS